ncbi:hypothetical protein RHO15_05990 [Utexia brackfieldae]|uniref:metal-binding protein n=1 Tax=Utexia brackfieldae TaxID=3074108 RepID=UPI00370DC309
MGNYSKNLSKRIENVRITEGYCLICGKYGFLTMDHVPPKGSITITKVEQKHIFDVLRAEGTKIKGVSSTNGSKFKTICAYCNNTILGANDVEISSVIKELNRKINIYFTNLNSIYNSVSVPFNPIKFCRAMIGHILSATTVKDCKITPQYTPYFTPLQEFVLGDDNALNNTHDIYYWFYPHKMHISSKMVSFYNNGNNCIVSILSFFPIAFLVTEKGKGIFPAQAIKLTFKDSHIVLNLSSGNLDYSTFPFNHLEGNQVILTSENHCIVSYPIKG